MFKVCFRILPIDRRRPEISEYRVSLFGCGSRVASGQRANPNHVRIAALAQP